MVLETYSDWTLSRPFVTAIAIPSYGFAVEHVAENGDLYVK